MLIVAVPVVDTLWVVTPTAGTAPEVGVEITIGCPLASNAKYPFALATELGRTLGGFRSVIGHCIVYW